MSGEELNVAKVCTATKRNGEKCQRRAVPGLVVCANHRPATMERQRVAGRIGGLASGLSRDHGSIEIKTLTGRWRALQVALDRAVAGDVKSAQAICGVVKTATELRNDEGRDAELAELMEQVQALTSPRALILDERTDYPLAIGEKPAASADFDDVPVIDAPSVPSDPPKTDEGQGQ